MKGRQTKKTDNSHLEEKIILRKAMIPNGGLRILDAYAGKGTIWKKIGEERKIEWYTAIEKERGKNPKAICGDNEKILPRLDLSAYNVIDLDAYGMPINQLLAVLENETLQEGTAIFVTCIGSPQGTLPHEGARFINATPEMFSKCKLLFNKKMREMLEGLLSEYGVKEAMLYEHIHDDIGTMNKIYLGFIR